MNILIYNNDSPYINKSFGGGETSLKLLAEKLTQRSHEITYLTKGHKNAFYLTMKRINDVNVMFIPSIKNCRFSDKEYFIHTITADNGLEFAEHKLISKKLDTKFYCSRPYSSWERGLNEYTNKLIRQYIPKKSDFSSIENQEIFLYQKEINMRPRKKLDYNSPLNIFSNL